MALICLVSEWCEWNGEVDRDNITCHFILCHHEYDVICALDSIYCMILKCDTLWISKPRLFLMQIYRFTSHVFSSNGASASAQNNWTTKQSAWWIFHLSNRMLELRSLHFNFPQCDVSYLYRYGRWTVYMSYTSHTNFD